MSVGMDTETGGLVPGDAVFVVALYDTRANSGSTTFIDNGNDDHLILSLQAMRQVPNLCTFNGTAFDFKMIAARCSNAGDKAAAARLALEHTDIMLQFATAKGYFSSLASFAEPTVESPKIMSGKDVAEVWASGAEGRQKVIDYCAHDAMLTAKLYDHGARRGYLKRKSKAGNVSRWGLTAEMWKPAYKCLEDYNKSEVDVSFMEDPPRVEKMADWACEFL